jgi:hypothetical protein
MPMVVGFDNGPSRHVARSTGNMERAIMDRHCCE